MKTVERSTVVGLPAADVWARATSEEGINDELRPILRMTMPDELRGKTVDDAEVGVPLGRSWILLLGVLPVEYDDLCLAELDPGRRFLERSSMATLRTWEHERIVETVDAGASRVTDRLGFELRAGFAWIPGAAQLVRAIVGALFSHRHRRLARLG